MIYTIGHRESYENNFKKADQAGEPLKKSGRRLSESGKITYMGGSVWETREEAEQHLRENQPRLESYTVYGVEADWENDTEKTTAGWNDLLKDSVMVKLPSKSVKSKKKQAIQ